MSAHLVLVTSNYPFTYTGGEVMFVAPEVERLCREFKRVTVVPQHAVGARLPTPDGVMVDVGLALAWRRWLWWSHVLAPVWPGFWREFLRAVRHGGWLGCARVWRWAAVAHLTRRWVQRAFPGHDPVLFYTYWRGGSTLALARVAGERPRAAAITRVHGHELYEERFVPPFQPWTSVYAALALTVPVSSHGLRHLLERGVPQERLWLGRLGTEDVALARPSVDGVLRVVSSSWMVAVKRVPLLAAALVLLASRHPQISLCWTHFGDGAEMGRVREALGAASGNLEVRLAGRVDNAVVLRHYASEPVDLFALLSANEGLPVSIQEAIAAGIPVLATDVGGVGEIVDADNGMLLPSGAGLNEIVTALEQLLVVASPMQRAAQRRAARERWRRDFDAERNHGKLARHLRALSETI